MGSTNKPETPPHAAFGERIAERREELHLTMRELAERVGLTQNHLYKTEAGWSMPRERKLVRIANALGLHFEWLRNGTGRRLLRNGEKNVLGGDGGDE